MFDQQEHAKGLAYNRTCKFCQQPGRQYYSGAYLSTNEGIRCAYHALSADKQQRHDEDAYWRVGDALVALQARVAELEAELAARPSDEYVRMLEEYAIDPGWKFLWSVCGWECVQRWWGDEGVGLCTHGNPPVGCLKAAAHEEE